MDDQQHYLLRWNRHHSHMVSYLKQLWIDKSFSDVTLACEGQMCQAHKIILSAGSPYFNDLFMENQSIHPIIILKDVQFNILQLILEFMYSGEISITEEQFPAIMKTVTQLKIKGFAQAPQINNSLVFSAIPQNIF